MSSCRECDAVWGGHKTCHCAACHETFSTEANFRLHQGAIAGCVDPRTDSSQRGELRFKLNGRGVWVENSSRAFLESQPTPLVEH